MLYFLSCHPSYIFSCLWLDNWHARLMSYEFMLNLLFIHSSSFIWATWGYVVCLSPETVFEFRAVFQVFQFQTEAVLLSALLWSLNFHLSHVSITICSEVIQYVFLSFVSLPATNDAKHTQNIELNQHHKRYQNNNKLSPPSSCSLFLSFCCSRTEFRACYCFSERNLIIFDESVNSLLSLFMR